ncbi:hypothetical protein K503DRAFT_792056 [Rhizopogon vinicolor AM-OR11-026]|uniref:GPI transamidase component PIG-S n=1 Tax=Rhizopogon vinicolor AM-OR11-026 TaxID=1314800 RepID=A0A1B7N336_9AGAM|nr:hypothetical protein K503DRAFT_792056 [Rhizopogon vinicolor AM-OR11-026]
MKSAAFASSGLKDPRKISFERNWVRRAVLASYWVVIVLAFPFWWHLTSIERLALPTTIHTLLRDSATSEYEKWKGIDPRQGARTMKVRPLVKILKAFDSYTVVLGEQTSIARSRQLRISKTDAQSATRLSSLLSDLIAPSESNISHSQRIAQYSDHYRLAFTLLHENATPRRFVETWDVQNALAEFVFPLLSKLSVLHNFKAESQVQYHAPPAFEPKNISLGDTEVSRLTQEDLTVFINSAEWTLSSSVSNDPALHFVIFAPSETRAPLKIIDGEVPSMWGGIFILNNELNSPSSHLSQAGLKPVFRNSATQLSVLLGVPPVPRGLNLDALLHRRALQNVQDTQDTLYSIVKLLDHIDNVPVGQVVRDDVLDGLASLHDAYHTATISLAIALRWSSKALSVALHAFFDSRMLALLYLPAEHKYTVYTPLIASISVPLVVVLIREFIACRRVLHNGGGQ